MVDEKKLQELVNSGPELPVMERIEAKNAGLLFYWSGKPCAKYGHMAKRRTSDSTCTACKYLTDTTSKENAFELNKAKMQEIQDKGTVEATIGVRKQQEVLERYAKTGSIESAARVIGLTVPQLNVQLAKSAVFAAKMTALERRLKVMKDNKDEIYTPSDLVWTDDLRDKFITAYIDTGSMAEARQAVGASPSNYFTELADNPDFASRVKDAKPKANQVLEEIAIGLAKKGNDKLLTVVLKALLPEYGDKLKIESTSLSYIRLSDDALQARIAEIANKYRVIDGSVSDVAERSRGAIGLLGRDGPETDEEQVPVSVSG